MKPIKLQFKGINSFSEQTEIDFDKLTKNGIFGIFGDTGSGKSTILDCINFALFGKVERSREKLDIINYRSEAAEVKFEFDVLTEGKRRRYAVERSIKKKSGLHKAVLYEDDACIADNASTVTKKITDILGVDAEDFRKCIALPQGEFSQFVKSQPSERIALIERLFSLSKYGDRLKDRLKDLERQAELNYQTLLAQIGLFADISLEVIKETEAKIEDLKKQSERLSVESSNIEKEFTALKTLADKRVELDETVKKLSEEEERKSYMEELRAGLKAVPLCRAVVETDSEIKQKSVALSEIEEMLSLVESEINKEKENLSYLNERSLNENFDEAIARCITLTAKYASCEGKPEKLSELEKKIDAKRNKYRVEAEKLSRFKQQLKQAEIDVKQAEKLLSDCGSKNLDQIINVDFKGAILKEEYVNTLDYFVGLNGQVKFHKDGSDLYKFLERELKQQIDVYKDRVYQVKDFSLAEARRQLKNFQSSNEERDYLSAAVTEKTAALKDAQSAVNTCEKDLSIIRRDGEELRKQYDELYSELSTVFGDVKNFAAVIKENTQILENLKQQKSKLAAETEQANKKLAELTARQAAKSAEKRTITGDIEKLNNKLKTTLSQSGFDSVENCKKLAYNFSEYEDAEKQLEEYDSKLKLLAARRSELEKVNGIESFSDELLKEAEEKKNSISAQLSQAREDLAVENSKLRSSSSRLTEKKALQKQLTAAEKERDLIAQLKDITKGNKFMEYIANEYLYDISTLASSTLLNLTDGRYFLTYTDTFYAGDNFNCGNLRGVNTLSGGETFLVSLSLALALSQTICASLKSIEFFFLDEGFGTLDGTLVDTVMNALEKLKSSRFTIGVISHVEELKHRIDNKITVNKATESHGSTVQISC